MRDYTYLDALGANEGLNQAATWFLSGEGSYAGLWSEMYEYNFWEEEAWAELEQQGANALPYTDEDFPF